MPTQPLYTKPYNETELAATTLENTMFFLVVTIISLSPYVLISALTAIHGGEWTVSDVSNLIQTIFEAQYTLTENVIVETRYYTDYTTEWQWVWDNYYQQWVQIPVTVEVQVPYDYYICTVTLEVKDLEAVVTEMMTDEQKILFNMYMDMKGNREDLFCSQSDFAAM